MKINGKVVTYEALVEKNNVMKTRTTNDPLRRQRVVAIDEPSKSKGYLGAKVMLEGVNAAGKTVRPVMTAEEVIYSVMNGHGCLTNVSAFKGWVGWKHI